MIVVGHRIPLSEGKNPKLHTTKIPTKVGERNVLSFLKMLIIFGYVFFHVYWHGHQLFIGNVQVSTMMYIMVLLVMFAFIQFTLFLFQFSLFAQIYFHRSTKALFVRIVSTFVERSRGRLSFCGRAIVGMYVSEQDIYTQRYKPFIQIGHKSF